MAQLITALIVYFFTIYNYLRKYKFIKEAIIKVTLNFVVQLTIFSLTKMHFWKNQNTLKYNYY